MGFQWLKKKKSKRLEFERALLCSTFPLFFWFMLLMFLQFFFFKQTPLFSHLLFSFSFFPFFSFLFFSFLFFASLSTVHYSYKLSSERTKNMAPIIIRSTTTTNIRPVDDRGGILLVMYWTECTIAIIVVSLRFYCRIKIRGVGLDDWTMLLTLVNREKKEKKKKKERKKKLSPKQTPCIF